MNFLFDKACYQEEREDVLITSGIGGFKGESQA